MPAIARLGDICTGHGCFPPRPNIAASPDVFANFIPVHRQGDGWAVHCCKSCHPGSLAQGSPTVWANFKQVGRIGDPVSCGSKVATGSPNIFVGDSGGSNGGDNGRLDQDLVADRSVKRTPDTPTITTPPVRLGESVIFTIENYLPEYTYNVSASTGEVSVVGDKIFYTAPAEYAGPAALTVQTASPNYEGSVILPDGMLMRADGRIEKAGVNESGNYELDGIELLNSAPGFFDGADDTQPGGAFPMGVSDYSYSFYGDNFSSINEFKQTDLFGTSHGTTQFDGSNNDNSNQLDYVVKSEANRAPDALPYVYKAINVAGSFYSTGIARNSNATGLEGNVFVGYGVIGEPGGSLTVVTDPPQLDRTDIIAFEIDLWDIEALLPDEIISLCLVSLELKPVLRGITTGHAYEWDQIKGDQTTVTWLTPKNQKDVIIDFGGVKVDRVFRFWTDRGTKYEKHYDVMVYGTPADRIYSTPQHKWVLATLGNHLNIKVHEASPLLLDHVHIAKYDLRINTLKNY